MLISCEKCSTTYVLDDKLIPAQGAPVQCTRCGHVFTAKAGAPAPVGTSTQMFGSPVAAAAPSKTMMFGAPGSEAPAPGGSAPPAKHTMMFGAPGNEAPAGGNAGGANRTMMFGAPGTDAPAPAPAAPAANKTVMFGAPGNEAPIGGAPPRATMMFGTPAAGAPTPGPAAPAPNKTVMFGVPAAAPPTAAAPSKTVMFGAPGNEAPAGGANRTMMFGAQSVDAPTPASAPPAGVPNKTMMFGAAGAPGPVGDDTETGPVPQPPPGSPRATMMFGVAAAQSAPAPAAKPSSTMMFGTPAAQVPAAPAPPAGKTSSTMMFGTRAPVESAPPAAPQKTSSTMIFGASPVVNPAPQKPQKISESTVRIGPEDLERMMRDREIQHRGDAATPVDSKPAAMPQKTQMFAMSTPDGSTPPAGSEPAPRQNKTQMFAMGDMERRVKGQSGVKDPSALDTFPPDQPAPPEPDYSQTVINDEPSPFAAQARQLATNAGIDDPGPRVELPPEAPDLLGQPNTQPMSPVDADPATLLRAQVARRNRIAISIIAIVLVGAALAVTWKVFGRRILSHAPPAAAVEATDQALSKLRYDDSKSKAEAVAMLVDVTQKFPDYVEGHAGLVTAVSLQLDDVQQRVRRIEQLVEKDNTRIARYNREHSPSNWESLAQGLSAQVEELIREHKPLAEQGQKLDGNAREAYKGLEVAVTRIGDPSKSARLAAWRAQALFHGVSGTEQAITLTTRYEAEARGEAPDGWIDLAIPEYAANARVSEELMDKANAKLDELHKRDATFLRTYVLQARLALIKKDLDGATQYLDQVLSMQKGHDVALELREWVRKLPRADEKKEAPAP